MITLYNRQDFVTFLRIMANRCAPVAIPDTQGSSIISGVINWTKIRSHKGNYLESLIVLSVGPYSGVSAERINDCIKNSGVDNMTLSNDEWMSLSDTIRKYHECTHFICRKNYPDKRDAVWDELVADAVGIYAAFGKYDPDLEKVFLGIEGNRYIGGRLENYVVVMDSVVKERAFDELSTRIVPVLSEFYDLLSGKVDISPFDAAIILEESMDGLWKVSVTA